MRPRRVCAGNVRAEMQCGTAGEMEVIREEKKKREGKKKKVRKVAKRRENFYNSVHCSDNDLLMCTSTNSCYVRRFWA